MIKQIIRFTFCSILVAIASLGIGLNIAYMTGDAALGKYLSYLLIFILNLVLCNDFFPKGLASFEKDKEKTKK